MCVLALLALCCVSRVFAQTPLTTINNPTGGSIVYGKVDGASNEAGAMGIILHSLHSRYGDRPQVGNVFRVRGTNSVALFFTLVKRTQGNTRVAGMLIASRASDGDVEAALLSDDAARFGTTINPMLTTVFSRWQPAGGPSGGGAASSGRRASTAASAGGDGVAPLHRYTAPDQSVSVSLPDGFKVTTAAGGTINAEGANGEVVVIGGGFNAMDTRNPRVQQTMRIVQQGGLRNTVYAKALYYPYGGDPGRTYADLLNMLRQRNGLPAATIEVAQETPVGGNCAHLVGRSDLKDGAGVREFSIIFCIGREQPVSGIYGNTIYGTAVPVALAAKERATMGAVLASFEVNEAVVAREANAIAAPQIAAIHQIGQRAAQQAADAHAAEDAHNRSVEARWDSQDKRNQAFSNYLLDQTVIQDNEHNAHGTVWNSTADLLVKSDPNRFEYVQTPNFWKGIDY